LFAELYNIKKSQILNARISKENINRENNKFNSYLILFIMRIYFLFSIFLSSFTFAQVGIGTQNPQGLFNIDGAKDNATLGAPTSTQQLNDFVVLPDGKVGIGTTEPNQKLQVVGNINFSGALMPNNSAGTAGQVLTSAGAGAVPTWSTAVSSNIYTADGTLSGNRIVTQGANSLTFSGTGKVGIGITSTTAKLEVGSELVSTDNVNAAATLLQFSRPSASNIKWGSIARFNMGSYEASPSPNNFAKSRLDLAMADTNNTAFTNVMTWQANGNVGIGNTSPSSPLVVQGTTGNGVLKLIAPSVAAGDNWWMGFGHGTTSTDANDRARIGVNILGGGLGRLFFTTGASGSQVNAMFIDESQRVGIGTTAPVTSSILELNSTSRALLLTRVATTASITNPINGMLIYDISANCVKAYENGAWSGCISSGSGSGTANQSTVIPSTISLFQNRKHFIASIYDANYLPYSAPTTTAFSSPIAPDATSESTIIDLQGSITTGGITVKIPVAATGSGTLPYFEQIITIPASMTEDGNARDLRLAWGTQTYTATTKTIDATIAAIGGELKLKKLDMNSGIGNDAQGILAGNFVFPFNAAGNTTNFEIRIIAGIPDRRFGQTTIQGPVAGTSGQYHNFIYIPVVAEDGRIWLNQNLGANYSNVNNSAFNPIIRASNIFDHNAKGSLFQWGRYSDGHELIYRTDATTSKHVNTLVSTQSTTDTPTFREVTRNNWRLPYNQFLWQGVDGVNNPCPIGFRVPTRTEYAVFVAAPINIYNLERMLSGALNLTASGISGSGSPEYTETIGGVTGMYRTISQDGSSGGYVAWMHASDSDGSNNNSYRWQFSGGDATGYATQGGGGTGNSMAVRCIQN